jgi:hypothetical protein
MTQETYGLVVTLVVVAILAALFWLLFRIGKDKHGRIRTYSAAWWLIVLCCPWGVLWALCRSDQSAAERARNLREITGAERIAMSKRPITKWLIRAGLFGLAGLLATSAYLIGVNDGHRRAAASPAMKACESALAYTLTYLNETNGRAPERHVAHPLSGIDWTIAVANEGPPNFHKQVIATSELPEGQRAACLMTAARRPDGRWEHRP